MKVHGIDKAIVKKTGEVVSLSPYRMKFKGEDIVRHQMLEDPNRIFTEDEIDALDEWEYSLWEFMGKYLSGYYQDDRVALSDDIECALTSEANKEKLSRVKYQCGENVSDWLREQIRIDTAMFEEAAHSYWEKTYKATL